MAAETVELHKLKVPWKGGRTGPSWDFRGCRIRPHGTLVSLLRVLPAGRPTFPGRSPSCALLCRTRRPAPLRPRSASPCLGALRRLVARRPRGTRPLPAGARPAPSFPPQPGSPRTRSRRHPKSPALRADLEARPVPPPPLAVARGSASRAGLREALPCSRRGPPESGSTSDDEPKVGGPRRGPPRPPVAPRSPTWPAHGAARHSLTVLGLFPGRSACNSGSV